MKILIGLIAFLCIVHGGQLHAQGEKTVPVDSTAIEYIEYVLNNAITIPDIAGQKGYALVPGFLFVNEFFPDIVPAVYQASLNNLASFYPNGLMHALTQSPEAQSKIYAGVGLFRVLFSYMILDSSFTHIIAFDCDPNVNAAHGILRLLLYYSDTANDFYNYLKSPRHIDILIENINKTTKDQFSEDALLKLKIKLIEFQKLYEKHIIRETRSWAFGNEAILKTSPVIEWLESPLPDACFKRLKTAARSGYYDILNIFIGNNDHLQSFIARLTHHLDKAQLGILDVSNTIDKVQIDIHPDNDYFNPRYLTEHNQDLWVQIIDWIFFLQNLLASGKVPANVIVISTEMVSVNPEDPNNPNGLFCHSGWPLLYGGLIPSKNTIFRADVHDVWAPDQPIEPIPECMQRFITDIFTTAALKTFLKTEAILEACNQNITALWAHFLPIGYSFYLLTKTYPESLLEIPYELILMYPPEYFKTRKKPDFTERPVGTLQDHPFDDPFSGGSSIKVCELNIKDQRTNMEFIDNQIRATLNPDYHIDLWAEARGLPTISDILIAILSYQLHFKTSKS